MFNRDAAGNITMHRGDTGAFKVSAARGTGDAWTDADRLLYTVRNAQNEVVLQRFYRLDDDEGLGNGTVEIQYHNSDTDAWPNGQYTAERRYIVNAYWNGAAPEGMVVNALAVNVRIIDGDIVRVPQGGHTTITIDDIYGEV